MRAYSVRKVRYRGMISYMPRLFTGTLSYRIYPRYKYRAGLNTIPPLIILLRHFGQRGNTTYHATDKSHVAWKSRVSIKYGDVANRKHCFPETATMLARSLICYHGIGLFFGVSVTGVRYRTTVRDHGC